MCRALKPPESLFDCPSCTIGRSSPEMLMMIVGNQSPRGIDRRRLAGGLSNAHQFNNNLPGVDPAEVCCPSLVARGSNRWHSHDPGPHADWAFANLPALDTKDPLHRVLVETKKLGDRSETEGRLLLNHGLDRYSDCRHRGDGEKCSIDPRPALGFEILHESTREQQERDGQGRAGGRIGPRPHHGLEQPDDGQNE